MDVKYVYTISDTGTMIPDVIRSIRSLRKYVDKKDILVFFTPPTSKLGYARVSKLASVKMVENKTKPFVYIKERGLGRYGEKCHICDVPSSTVVFLDADTLIRKDLTPLLNGDFDFSARLFFPSNISEKGWINTECWLDLFTSMGKKHVPMPDGGFMIFKNFSHHKIKEEWIKFINTDNLSNACTFGDPKELTALALALSGMKIRWLTVKEHAFSWLGEKNVETYVLHKPKFLPKPLYYLEEAFNTYTSLILRAVSNAFF